MDRPATGPLVVFTHIPKCGGTTVEAALRRLVGPPPRLVRWDRGKGPDPFSAGEDRVVALTGHFRWDDPVPWPAGRERLLFATVRDPVARYVSYYSYQRMKAEAAAEGDPVRRFLHFSLDEFAESGLRKVGRSGGNTICEAFSRDGRAAAALAVIERHFTLVVSLRAVDRLNDLLSRLLTGRSPAVPVPRKRASGSERYVLDPTLRRQLEGAFAEDRALVAAVEDGEERMLARAAERAARLWPLFRDGGAG